MAVRSRRTFTCRAQRGTGAADRRRSQGRLVIDFTQRGKPIGIEITAPSRVTVAAVTRVLKELGLPLIKRPDLAPLRAA
jgi:uncharacterized protein YuzE